MSTFFMRWYQAGLGISLGMSTLFAQPVTPCHNPVKNDYTIQAIHPVGDQFGFIGTTYTKGSHFKQPIIGEQRTNGQVCWIKALSTDCSVSDLVLSKRNHGWATGTQDGFPTVWKFDRQAHGRILWTGTFGKGVGQVIVPLPGGGVAFTVTFGSQVRLIRIADDGQFIWQVPLPDSLRPDAQSRLTVTPAGKLIATVGGGLFVVDISGKIEHQYPANGSLPNYHLIRLLRSGHILLVGQDTTAFFRPPSRYIYMYCLSAIGDRYSWSKTIGPDSLTNEAIDVREQPNGQLILLHKSRNRFGITTLDTNQNIINQFWLEPDGKPVALLPRSDWQTRYSLIGNKAGSFLIRQLQMPTIRDGHATDTALTFRWQIVDGLTNQLRLTPTSDSPLTYALAFSNHQAVRQPLRLGMSVDQGSGYAYWLYRTVGETHWREAGWRSLRPNHVASVQFSRLESVAEVKLVLSQQPFAIPCRLLTEETASVADLLDASDDGQQIRLSTLPPGGYIAIRIKLPPTPH